MSNSEFAICYLKAVEKNYKAYFEKSRLSILNCVIIKGTEIISVHINQDLPFEIKHDIEMMFWVD